MQVGERGSIVGEACSVAAFGLPEAVLPSPKLTMTSYQRHLRHLVFMPNIEKKHFCFYVIHILRHNSAENRWRDS